MELLSKSKDRTNEQRKERDRVFAKLTRPWLYRDTAIDIACQLSVTSATENSARIKRDDVKSVYVGELSWSQHEINTLVYVQKRVLGSCRCRLSFSSFLRLLSHPPPPVLPRVSPLCLFIFTFLFFAFILICPPFVSSLLSATCLLTDHYDHSCAMMTFNQIGVWLPVLQIVLDPRELGVLEFYS